MFHVDQLVSKCICNAKGYVLHCWENTGWLRYGKTRGNLNEKQFESLTQGYLVNTGCSELFQNTACSELFSNTGCSELFRNSGFSELFKNTKGNIQGALNCSGIPGALNLSWTVDRFNDMDDTNSMKSRFYDFNGQKQFYCNGM